MIFTARKRSLGQGNMFTGVCLSTGGCLVGGCLLPGGACSGGGVPAPRGVPGGDPPMATAAGSTNLTGMHSCCISFDFHVEIPIEHF